MSKVRHETNPEPSFDKWCLSEHSFSHKLEMSTVIRPGELESDKDVNELVFHT